MECCYWYLFVIFCFPGQLFYYGNCIYKYEQASPMPRKPPHLLLNSQSSASELGIKTPLPFPITAQLACRKTRKVSCSILFYFKSNLRNYFGACQCSTEYILGSNRKPTTVLLLGIRTSSCSEYGVAILSNRLWRCARVSVNLLIWRN